MAFFIFNFKINVKIFNFRYNREKGNYEVFRNGFSDIGELKIGEVLIAIVEHQVTTQIIESSIIFSKEIARF